MKEPFAACLRNCERCGSPFTAKRSDRRFCGEPCRKKSEVERALKRRLANQRKLVSASVVVARDFPSMPEVRIRIPQGLHQPLTFTIVIEPADDTPQQG